MKTYKVNDKSVVVILSKRQAIALYRRSLSHTGVRDSKEFLNARFRLLEALGQSRRESC